MESPLEGALLLQGMLEKRRCSKMSSLVGKSWDPRWFVLTSSSLTYYRSQEDHDWGAAGTVMSLTSLRRFESLSSLVFQLYFYQRILQLRAAQEQEAKTWITCLQSIQSEQQVTLSRTAAKLQLSSRPAAANSPGGKSASAAGDGVLMINAKSSIDTEINPAQEADARGVLPAHLFVEESRVSYSPLSEHAAASPFLSDAHMLTNRASGPAGRLTLRQPACTAEAATSTEDEAQMNISPVRRLNFVGPTTADSPISRHQRSQSAVPSSPSPGQEALAVTSRSASYHASSSSPFDHATGGFFAPEDIEQLYALPDGAHPGRLCFTDDLDGTDARHAAAAHPSSSGGSSPLYRSCSSGSDDTPAGGIRGTKGGLSDAAGTVHDVSSEMQRPLGSGRLLDVHSTAVGMQTSRDDRVFWVPEHGGEEQPFTEYTKQQMGSTLQVPAPVQFHAPPSMSAASPSRQTHGVMQEPSVHAWTTSQAEADMTAATSGHTPMHQSAHAWTAPLLDGVAVGNDSGSWQRSFPAEEGPHPPDVPGPHSGMLHATSGFRGGRREDPRLRRFKDAWKSAETPVGAGHTSRAIYPRQGGSRHSVQDHSTRNESPGRWSGMLQAVDSVSHTGSSVGITSVEVQMSQQLTEVETIDAEEKKYWRAPPSLAWATLPMTAESNDAGNVTWAEYCSDSE